MKVCIYPTPESIPENNGIGRIVHAQYRHLPSLGVELVGPEQADVIAVHTDKLNMPRADVVHLHGMYWTAEPHSGKYNKWHWEANRRIIQTVREAQFVTVPSEWVAMPFKRDMRINPVVIGHGIDFAKWQPGQNKQPYVLWNKNRMGDVCNPQAAYELAQRGAKVISTFAPIGTSHENLTVVGPQTAERMQYLISNTKVYLATVKETFGIGTLEAMACGVPVLGFNWGGTATIVEHLKTGYLVTPGDYDALYQGYLYILDNWDELSENARYTAMHYDWPIVMQQYVDLYQQVQKPVGLKVSVVIPTYNYGKYVESSIRSVLQQSLRCEVIVVDDGSTDDTPQRVKQFGDSVGYLRTENRGVSSARNLGISRATGDLIICLDADDELDSRYAETLQKAFTQDRALGVAYTGLGLIKDSSLAPNSWPPAFKWEHMATGGNPPASCIPSAAMFRKSMWERAGGYRQQYAPAEDTEFWLRGLSLGFTAKQVVPDALFHYRPHEGSASRTKQYKPIDAYYPWTKDRQYPMAAPTIDYVAVRSYSEPLVSVIIPVGPGHTQIVKRTIESVIGQTFRNWELIVVDDSGEKWRLEEYPFVKLVKGNQTGPGAARNLGLDNAKAPLSLFLDADDYLAPNALEVFVHAYSLGGGRYIYSDWKWEDGSYGESATFSPEAILTGPRHPITALVTTSLAREVRFNEDMDAFEDWDFFAHLVINGEHGYRIERPLVIVSRSDSGRTAKAQSSVKYWQHQFETKFAEANIMSCCGGGGDATIMAKINLGLLAPEIPAPLVGEVRMEFTGESVGAQTYGGPGITPSGKAYRGGNNNFDRYLNADPRDVEWLERTNKFKRIIITPALSQVSETPVEELTPPTPAEKNDSYELIESAAEVANVEAPIKEATPEQVALWKREVQPARDREEVEIEQSTPVIKSTPKKFGKRR